MHRLVRVPGLFLAAWLTGCATIVHGTTQTIPIASSPPGATVLIDDVPVGVTPMVATVARKRAHVVSFVVDSVTTDRVALRRQMSPLVLADIFLLYVAPVALDMSNGSAYNFPNDTIRAVPGPMSAGVRRPPISEGVRAAAVTTGALIGFGSGHAVVDLPARRFLALDLVASAAFVGGFVTGYGGRGSGTALLISGGGLLIGSRIWQVVDLDKRTAPKSP